MTTLSAFLGWAAPNLVRRCPFAVGVTVGATAGDIAGSTLTRCLCLCPAPLSTSSLRPAPTGADVWHQENCRMCRESSLSGQPLLVTSVGLPQGSAKGEKREKTAHSSLRFTSCAPPQPPPEHRSLPLLGLICTCWVCWRLLWGVPCSSPAHGHTLSRLSSSPSLASGLSTKASQPMTPTAGTPRMRTGMLLRVTLACHGVPRPLVFQGVTRPLVCQGVTGPLVYH